MNQMSFTEYKRVRKRKIFYAKRAARRMVQSSERA